MPCLLLGCCVDVDNSTAAAAAAGTGSTAGAAGRSRNGPERAARSCRRQPRRTSRGGGRAHGCPNSRMQLQALLRLLEFLQLRATRPWTPVPMFSIRRVELLCAAPFCCRFRCRRRRGGNRFGFDALESGLGGARKHAFAAVLAGLRLYRSRLERVLSKGAGGYVVLNE